MNTHQWLSLAVAKSKHQNDNLKQTYRDIDKIVATDGHRLHLQLNQPSLSATPVIDYPDYTKAIITHTNTCDITLFPDRYLKLKTILKQCEFVDLKLVGTDFFISSEIVDSTGSQSNSLYLNNVLSAPHQYTAFFNASYLLDVFKICDVDGIKISKTAPVTLTLNFSGAELNSLNITCMDLHAVLMPLKPPTK